MSQLSALACIGIQKKNTLLWGQSNETSTEMTKKKAMTSITLLGFQAALMASTVNKIYSYVYTKV